MDLDGEKSALSSRGQPLSGRRGKRESDAIRSLEGSNLLALSWLLN